MVQAEEAKQPEESCWAAEAELLQDEVAKEAEGAADSEKTPEARPQEFSRERGEEEAQMGVEALEAEWGGLEHEVTENQGASRRRLRRRHGEPSCAGRLRVGLH